jgi:antitoxin component of MazEF toxin-antitoxin module
MAHTQSTPASAPAQDPNSRDFVQKKTRNPSVRRLTVCNALRDIQGPDGRTMRAPQLLLRGAWLQRAGFTIGRPVTIQVSEGRLVIELAEPERVPQAEAFAKIARVADGDLLKRDVDRFVRELKRRRR